MTRTILGKTLQPLNQRRFTRPIALVLSALFIISTISAIAVQPTAAAPATSALHTSGSYILDANGNSIYLRGIGLAGFAPNLMIWNNNENDNWGAQWNHNPTTTMEQTFQTMKNQWHINMIRIFIYPSWWYKDNIVPAQESSSYASSTTPISIKAYMQNLCNVADKYGIYVNIVPYMLTPSTSSYDKDPYASSGFGWQGMPMCGWDEPAQRFLNDAGYGNNEQGFWRWFWTDMATTLKDCPNAIFEAWNEPNVGTDVDMIPTGYMTYLRTMYDAIRGTGSNHLVMMQWHMGWFPNGYGNTLSWVKQIDDAFHPTNIVYTTHFYYYAPTDLSSYWAKDYATLKSQIQTGVDSMGIVAPLVINEEGSCLSSSPNKQNDYTWWKNILLAQRDLNIGAVPYYWLSDSGLGPVFSGETVLSNGYSPNTMGQHFIDAYAPTTTNPIVPSTPTPTSAPTATPTPTPTATLTPSPIQDPSPTPTPIAAPTITPTSQPTTKSTPPTPIPTPEPTTKPTTTNDPTNTPTPTTEPSNQKTPGYPWFRGHYHYWHSWFSWSRFSFRIFWFR